MMEVIRLIVPNLGTRDELGAWHRPEAEETRTVLCSVSGVRRSEWAAAGAAGHRPELVATVPTADYQGELEAEYAGVRYRIYRTYPVSDWETELYLEARTGVTR